MIIHSYLTDGFFGWAKIFVKSFRLYHGDEHKIFLCTRDLKGNQINRLKAFYPNIHISNRRLDLHSIAKRAKKTIPQIKKLKDHIENNAVTQNTFVWKQAISVEDRYRTSITEAMDTYPDEDYLIHFDIDMYFREHLSELFSIVTSNDISIKFRLQSQLNRKVMGGLIGFKLNKETRQFMDRWIHHIDAIPLYKKPLGYGQTSFYKAYVDLKDQFKWGHIPGKFISPRFLDTDVIWSGNTTNGKTKNLDLCNKDFIKRKK